MKFLELKLYNRADGNKEGVGKEGACGADGSKGKSGR
jgi:hypothetical protein